MTGRSKNEDRSSGNWLIPQMKMVFKFVRTSRKRTNLFLLVTGLAIVVGATAYGQIKLNAWNQPFYDALFRKDLSALGVQLSVFGLIAGSLLILNVAQTWLNQTTKVNLREELTRDLFAQWLTPKRAFLLAGAGEIGLNPDQRIHEDTKRFAELSADLGIGLVQATLLLASFIGVLWALSEGITFEVLGASFSIPGYMVWAALLYAGTASWASWCVGRRLINLDTERYAREASLRYALMHVNGHSDGIAVYRGESDEQSRLHREFDRLLLILRRLVGATTNLTWVTAGYGWFTLVAPIMAAAPAYFAGSLSVGGTLMAVGAFNQVQQSLRWFIDNFGSIADWRATLHRVGDLHQALTEIDDIGKDTSHIELLISQGEKLRFDNLCIFSPSGCTTLSEENIEITPSEHIIIVGAPGSGKTSLFRAMAGLWLWGSGKISLPLNGSIIFMPEKPYILDGTLREVLSYPALLDDFVSQDVIEVLDRFGLSHLTSDLDRVAQWDRELTVPEQQAIAFARTLLHRPKWLVIDEAIDSLTPEAREVLFDVFDSELMSTTVIYISGREMREHFYSRKFFLTKDSQGPCLSMPCLPAAKDSV